MDLYRQIYFLEKQSLSNEQNRYQLDVRKKELEDEKFFLEGVANKKEKECQNNCRDLEQELLCLDLDEKGKNAQTDIQSQQLEIQCKRKADEVEQNLQVLVNKKRELENLGNTLQQYESQLVKELNIEIKMKTYSDKMKNRSDVLTDIIKHLEKEQTSLGQLIAEMGSFHLEMEDLVFRGEKTIQAVRELNVLRQNQELRSHVDRKVERKQVEMLEREREVSNMKLEMRREFNRKSLAWFDDRIIRCKNTITTIDEEHANLIEIDNTLNKRQKSEDIFDDLKEDASTQTTPKF